MQETCCWWSTDSDSIQGGTLIECKAVLLAEGAAKVSAYVTHAGSQHV